MAKKTKTRIINIVDDKGVFKTFFKRFATDKKNYDFEGLSALRNLLSNEKSRLLHAIKNKSPSSIYQLAKILERDFKSVSDDVKLLERFGFIELISENTGNRSRLKPVIIVDSIQIEINI